MKLVEVEPEDHHMNHENITRYRLQLDMVERDGALTHRRAGELLRSEFALAMNASYFLALSADDIEIGAIWRSVPRRGVARYAVELFLRERNPVMTDEQAAELLAGELARAQNASHFLRIAAGDFDEVTRLTAEAVGIAASA